MPVVSLEMLLADVDAGQRELLGIWRNLIRFPTVNTGVMPTGYETPCAEYLAGLLGREGCRAEVLESAPRRGNVVAELPGVGGGRSLLLMSHLDVVPPGDETRWTWPPFEGVERDGWIYGRGCNDCKGLTAAQAYALVLLGRRRVALPGTVRLAAGADEECGGAYGFGWLAAEHPERLRADLAVNEGGGGLTRLADGSLGCLVACGEKGRLEARLTLYGQSHHASAPWLADNPMDRLPGLLERLAAYRPVIQVAALAEQIEAAWGMPAPAPDQLDAFLDDQAAARPSDCSRIRALSRMTWAPTMLAASEKSNAIPDKVTLVVDVRTLPGQTTEDVRRELHACVGGIRGLEIRLEVTAETNHSPLTDEVAEVYSSCFADVGEPGVRCLGSLCGGFTDARLVRPLGTPVHGFAPLPAGIDLDRCGCHNVDEQFPLEAVVYRTKLLLALIWRWCGR